MSRDVALRRPIHAPMHDVETAGEIGIRAATVGKHQLEARIAVEHAGHQQRADAERGVEGVLRNLGEAELCGARCGPDQDGMDQHGHAERFGLAPERLQRKFAQIGVLDVGGNDHAAGSEPGGALELRRRGLGLNERNGGDPGEPIRVVGAPRRQGVVEHPMPGDACIDGKAVAE